MLLEMELFRLSFCNSHMESMCENLKLKIPGISCKQLVLDKDTWLEGGLIKLGEVLTTKQQHIMFRQILKYAFLILKMNSMCLKKEEDFSTNMTLSITA
jgi:hypothetical protein